LVYLQTVETDDKGMWHNQVNIISCCTTLRIVFLVENKQLAKILYLIGNDLETSKILYFISFCIKSKERFLFAKIQNIFVKEVQFLDVYSVQRKYAT
jgi:hypothetical protein